MDEMYGTAIKIIGNKGASTATWAAMPDKDARSFIKTIRVQLANLAKLGTGRNLLNWIEYSGKNVTIYCAEDGFETGCHGSLPLTEPEPQGWPSVIAASVRPFRKAQVTLPTPKAREQDDLVANFKTLFDGLKLPTTKTTAAQELETVLRNAAQGAIDNRSPKFTPQPGRIANPLEAGAQAAGISQVELMEMAQGQRKIPDDVYFKLAFYFYDFLTSGVGVDTAIRMINSDEWAADSNKSYKPKTNPDDSPGYIVLGHELIHAFRMMIGKRLVHNGWEEEAMTSGIWEFTSWNYTENMLRAEASLPLRLRYQCTPHVNSPWAQNAMSNQKLYARI